MVIEREGILEGDAQHHIRALRVGPDANSLYFGL
jgi:hypothetical protein